MDKVSRQPGIYSPGGVCAAAERRKVMGNPTDKQVNYAMYLLSKAGYSTRYMDSSFKSLGATMRERSGTVDSWLRSMSSGDISRLISRLSGKSNPHNPDELETVFSPESVASKLTLATAVPGAAVAMTAIELAHAVDAGLVDETAAVLMRPAEEVAEAVVGVSNPRQPYILAMYDVGEFRSLGEQHFTTARDRDMAIRELRKSYTIDSSSKSRDGRWVKLTIRAKRGNPRRNPSTDADAMYESFHGQPPTETVEVVEELREHGHLATLGTLVELKLQSMAGKDVSIEWTKDNPYLASNEHGTQLYIVGGDQTVDLKALGMAGDKWEREHMVLGVCHEVTYRTRKGFDKFRLVDYYHNLGEETGVQPMLAYDTVNDKLSIVGGQYEVKPEGIVN